MDDFSEAVPAFFAGLFMALCYSISYVSLLDLFPTAS